MAETVRCPKCGRKQPLSKTPHDTYYCEWCRMMFDDEPDEEGDYCTDPTRRLMREEGRRERRRR